MIRRHIIMSAALASIALSSCNGGDDNASPSPTPTPTATPTPTPTASPTYAAFPLSSAVEFTTITAATSFTGDPAGGALTLGVAGTEQRSSRVSLAVGAAIATDTYVIRENTEESRFTTANVVTASAPANPEYIFRTTDSTTAGKFAQLEFLNNTIPSTVTTDAGLALTRVSYANWYRGDSTAGAKRLTYTVFGYATTGTDVPTTGTVAYTSRVTGRVVYASGVQKIGGTVTVSVNFSTGLVDLTFNLTQTTDAGVTTAYAPAFTAQGAIPVGQSQFTGSFASGAPLTGTFAGGLYGSQGLEVGISFAGTGTNNRLVGVIVGKKP